MSATSKTPHPQEAVILVGHGGVPTDYPRDKVRRLMALEGQRRAAGTPMSSEEAELDAELRNHPRTPQTDPYKAGIEAVATALARALSPGLDRQALYIAYNEFCAPSVEQAVEQAVADGAEHITLVSTMLTPGGSHAEEELPELVDSLRQTFPAVAIKYAWPVNLDAFAGFLASHLQPHRPSQAQEQPPASFPASQQAPRPM